MTRNAFVVRTALALLLSAGSSLAQQAPAAPVPPAPAAGAAAPAAGAAKPSPAPPPAAPGAAGPDAPVGKVTQALQEKLEIMTRGNGLTANQVAERAVKSSSQLAAKRRSIESAAAQVDQAKASFYPTLNMSARYTRLSDIAAPNLGNIIAPAPGTPAGPVDVNNTQLFAFPLSFPLLLNR